MNYFSSVHPFSAVCFVLIEYASKWHHESALILQDQSILLFIQEAKIKNKKTTDFS